jgi:hypothetical protein
MWDSTLAEIFKVDDTQKVRKITLKVDNKLYRVNRPKIPEWDNVKQDDQILVTVDKSPDGRYGKLYNMSERTEAKVVLTHVTDNWK